jgi:hypothetical protein|tara:strand:+ start:1473 stop:1751 length:279 start_codon:yes stop_codon:yes gene_type:complete
MTNLFISGSMLRCINICSLYPADNDQRLVPFAQSPWTVFLEPGELALVLDITINEALMLIGNHVFSFNCQINELQKYFEPVTVSNKNKESAL